VSKLLVLLFSIGFALLSLACGVDRRMVVLPEGDDGSGHVAPTEFTVKANEAVWDELPFGDERDFLNATAGLIAKRSDPIIRTAEGKEVWNLDRFAFIKGKVPASVNPSLWRQARLNSIHGLFKVTDRVYQVRGYDLANMTIVAGDTGWIIIDSLTTFETAQAAIELVRKHLGERPVVALIYTHSHIDHFGGAKGVLSESDLERGVPVIAPEGFVAEAVSENVLAGTAMSRRASYMFGFLLGRGPREHVDSGLGKASTPGTFGLIPPNEIIRETGTRRTIDGVELVFQNTPGAEAPAEMMIYFPGLRALCGAENVSHVLHNVYTLRGAKVRDALRWSNYLTETIDLFGADTDVLFASHHWPSFGNEAVIDHLERQRDVYKYIHDQTLRLANHGYTPIEIAEQLELPEELSRTFANRDYYGTLSHNSKAVYQMYFGWFDGNPANLNPLPPEEAGARYVAAMGGAAAVLATAQAAYDEGDYRWVGTLLDHLVFADPTNRAARSLLADAYDQLGYQAESGPWRDFYLTGAKELREGVGEFPLGRAGTAEIVSSMPTGLFFDALAVRLNGSKAASANTRINFIFSDIGETHVVEVRRGVLHHREAEPREDADATVKLTRTAWDQIVTGAASLPGLIAGGEIDIDGSRLKLIGFFAMLDDFEPAFDIVTP
jgi:alkyl sulfatase BDS1-like metallo-beta-lactamase superfamily hydrolase